MENFSSDDASVPPLRIRSKEEIEKQGIVKVLDCEGKYFAELTDKYRPLASRKYFYTVQVRDLLTGQLLNFRVFQSTDRDNKHLRSALLGARVFLDARKTRTGAVSVIASPAAPSYLPEHWFAQVDPNVPGFEPLPPEFRFQVGGLVVATLQSPHFFPAPGKILDRQLCFNRHLEEVCKILGIPFLATGIIPIQWRMGERSLLSKDFAAVRENGRKIFGQILSCFRPWIIAVIGVQATREAVRALNSLAKSRGNYHLLRQSVSRDTFEIADLTWGDGNSAEICAMNDPSGALRRGREAAVLTGLRGLKARLVEKYLEPGDEWKKRAAAANVKISNRIMTAVVENGVAKDLGGNLYTITIRENELRKPLFMSHPIRPAPTSGSIFHAIVCEYGEKRRLMLVRVIDDREWELMSPDYSPPDLFKT